MESAGNSTIQTLGTSSSVDLNYLYDGTPQVTKGYNYIHVIFNATYEGILTVRQSIDSIIWDINDTYLYPDVELNTAMFITVPVKAKYFSIQFENTSSNNNDIRLQSLLNTDAYTIAGGNMDVVVKNINPIDVTISNNNPINVKITNDISVNAIATIINTVDNPVPVSFNDILTVKTDISSVTINNNTNNPVPVDVVSDTPISLIWENNNIKNDLIIISPYKTVIYNIYATNFAPDYRYLKLYNSIYIDILNDRPYLTIPLPSDVPQFLNFSSKGLNFEYGISSRVTRLYAYNDENITMEGDVALTVMYKIMF